MAETDLETTAQAQAQNGKSPEGSPEKKEDSANSKAKAMMCLVSGKRHLLCQDIASAVTSLGEACELLVAEFGEKAPECAEAYFYYGRALLEAARLEAGVLGNIDTDGESEEKSEDDDDEEEEEEGEKEEGDEKETPEEDGEGKKEAEPEKAKEDIDGDGKETEDAAEQAQEDEEDPSNLQLAWEMLELAKMVLVDQLEAKESKLAEETKNSLERRLFETYLILGEVSLENENYPQAVEDLSICLEKQKSVLPEDSRDIAVTYYQLGIALGFNMKYEEAIDKLQLAIGVLKKRIDNLVNKTESVDDSKKNDAFYTREKEIAELEALIPEIKEKITDTIEMKEESARKIAEVKEQIGFGSGPSQNSSEAGPSGAKPISTISVKRKADNSSSEADKKAKTENGQN